VPLLRETQHKETTEVLHKQVFRKSKPTEHAKENVSKDTVFVLLPGMQVQAPVLRLTFRSNLRNGLMEQKRLADRSTTEHLELIC
jgi:hypothetical protein